MTLTSILTLSDTSKKKQKKPMLQKNLQRRNQPKNKKKKKWKKSNQIGWKKNKPIRKKRSKFTELKRNMIISSLELYVIQGMLKQATIFRISKLQRTSGYSSMTPL